MLVGSCVQGGGTYFKIENDDVYQLMSNSYYTDLYEVSTVFIYVYAC